MYSQFSCNDNHHVNNFRLTIDNVSINVIVNLLQNFTLAIFATAVKHFVKRSNSPYSGALRYVTQFQ